MRRPLLFMAVLLGAGVWFSEHFSGEYAAYAGMAFGAAAVALSRRFPVLAAGAAAVAVFVFGWTRGSLARRIPEDSIHRVSVGYATMYGTVIRPFQKNKFHRTGWVELDTMEAGGKRFSVSGRMVVKIVAPGDDRHLPDGARIRFSGRFKSVDLAVEHEGYLRYLQQNRITHQATTQKYVVVSQAGFRPAMWRVRRYFAAPFEEKIHDASVRGVALALILGDRAELDSELRRAYAAGGAAHVLALSGAHLMILSLMVGRMTALAKRFPGGRTVGAATLVGVLFFYALMTGASPSVVRATWTAAFLALAPLLHRRADSLNVLGAAFALQILVDPFVLYDWGFQLSYSAVAGILLLVPALRPSKLKNKVMQSVVDLAVVSLAAQAFALPFVLHYFGQFPVHFLWVNVLLFPLVGVVMPVGFLLAVLGRVPGVGEALAWLMSKPVGAMNGLMTAVAGRSDAVWHVKLDDPLEAFFLAALILAVTLMLRAIRRPGNRKDDGLRTA
jgi:ComEC/Rec2-related protein